MQFVELTGMNADILVLSQGKVFLRKRVDHKAMCKGRGLVCKRALLQEVFGEVLVEFVQAFLISREPDVLLRDAVPEINPNHRMNACFLCRSEKGKHRSAAVDVRECKGVYLSLFCFGYERIY